MSKFYEHLSNSLKKVNIDISEEQIDSFEKYYELLIEWNSFMNLTSITDMDEVIDKHFVDSILLLKYISFTDEEESFDKIIFSKNSSLIDIGSGAGFPGIPLKIMCPYLKFTLVDSLNKRINFLNEVIDKLSLDNITAIHSRAEIIGKNSDHREKYDICFSRAVSNLSVLSEFCLPLVKNNGYFISYKGSNIDEELDSAGNAIDILGGKVLKTESFIIPDTDNKRSLIFIKKDKATPKQYPRKEGTPLKNPL